MSKIDKPIINQAELAAEWQRTLPNHLNQEEKVKITQNEKDPQGLQIQITTAGRTFYKFEFKVTYLDSREVKVEFVLASEDNKAVDEHTDLLQETIHDYERHLHECAQELQRVTHS